jgi:hypothetical protein
MISRFNNLLDARNLITISLITISILFFAFLVLRTSDKRSDQTKIPDATTEKSDKVAGTKAARQQPITEIITLAERDEGCLDKAITQAAIQKPVPWVPKPGGRKGFRLAFGDAFVGADDCVYWSANQKARVRQRDGELACLERIDAPRYGKCYWTAVARPPSKRAGPMPSEDSKPPYDKTLWEEAQNEIRDALEAMPGYERLPKDQQHKIWTQLLRKQAAPYAHESDRYMSLGCVPAIKTNDEKTACEFSRAQFQISYGLALRGDYESQQYIALCLRSPKPCDGVVTENKALSCAWQMVSLASGDKRITQMDIKSYQFECVTNRTPTEAAVIRAQAEALFVRTYHKSLPRGF